VDKSLKFITVRQCDAKTTVAFPLAQRHRSLAHTNLGDRRTGM